MCLVGSEALVGRREIIRDQSRARVVPGYFAEKVRVSGKEPCGTKGCRLQGGVEKVRIWRGTKYLCLQSP
ncbi:hypothetical protein B0T26DRAFT_723955 [Lasiosphaeria miniovina]|uniref:Uncharacterized protein n=1 Tax=Lasiosphaeria miniovina TaxID=1954250 RepID=A0AA40DR02_9PEZI|nr:uncharacterized protein B0T26DRAFT_723955 [Lasiosphaeria miniovina]KAK0710062.1 hypothetical protein B0T26DRAFT_723955 [Lasiosphaeria miniovina]